MSATPELDKLRATLAELDAERAEQKRSRNRKIRKATPGLVTAVGIVACAAGAFVPGAAMIVAGTMTEE